MRVVYRYTVIFSAVLFAVVPISSAHSLNPSDYVFDHFTYDEHPDLVEYDQSLNNDVMEKNIKTNIRQILEQNNLETNLKIYKRTRSQDPQDRRKVSPDYLNDHPYTSVHFAYHDDIIDEPMDIEDIEADEHVQKLFHAIEHNELLELYVECAKFSKIKEQYYMKRGRNEKKRFNRQVFDEIENFCEFIKTDDDDFII